MNRRTLLSTSAKAMACAGLHPLVNMLGGGVLRAQASSGYKALVCVFLGGGIDGNNILIPRDGRYASYANPRPAISIAKDSLISLSRTSSGDDYGTHPLLKKVGSLYNQKQLGFLANVGTLPHAVTKAQAQDARSVPINMFSHSAQIGEWFTASTQQAVSTGWAGRIADVFPSSSMPAVVSTAGFQLIAQGKTSQFGTASDGSASVATLSALSKFSPYMQLCETGSQSSAVQAHLAGLQSGFLDQSKVFDDAFSAGGGLKTVFPATSLGQQLQTVVQMINGRGTHTTTKQIFVCVDGGYDTHSGQTGMATDYLTRVDDAIGAYAQGMQEINMYDSATLFTASDFGRSLLGNGSGGSDHAWGNHHMIVGGAVHGGDVYGRFPDLTLGGPDDLVGIGTWIPTTSATQYASTLAQWLGVPESSLPAVFPELGNFPQPRLSFI